MPKILVIGEICADKFIYCDIKRLSPEAPVPILNPIRTTKNPGMAGNTLANIKALIPDSYTMSIGQVEAITKTRYVEQKTNHMFLRVDEGEGKITPFEWSLDIDVLIGKADIVIVSDYNKGFLTNADLKEIARKSTLSILDSKRKLTDDIIKDFTFVKLNESERINNPQITLDNVIITLGKYGAQHQGVEYPSSNPQDTIDVSGAGDTFVASFIAKYYQTKDTRLAIKFANQMSAEVVSKRGVVTAEKNL